MIKAIAWAAAVYGALVAVIYVMQRALVYVPDRHRPEPSASGVPDMKPVSLSTADGLELLAWWRPPENATTPVLAYFHGNAGNIGYRGPKVRPYLDRGWGVLLTTWRGYSGNPGSPSEDGLYADGRAALAFLAENGVAPARTIYYGESLGSGVAVAMAVETAPGALVLEAPFTSLADAGARKFPIFPVRLLVWDRFDNMARIGRVHAPLLIVHGESDGVVPVDHGRRLLEAANEPKQGHFIVRAAHNDLYDHQGAALVIEFVERYLGK